MQTLGKPYDTTARRFITLSFSGAGHLLTYHLGCASALLRRSVRPVETQKTKEAGAAFKSDSKGAVLLPRVDAVSGSSSGAVAAVVFARLPDRVEEFADRFMERRGGALDILRNMMHEEERRESRSSMSTKDNQVNVCATMRRAALPSLHIAATRCSDGRLHLFSFPRDNGVFRSISAGWNTDQVLQCVEASCRIPPSFHPIDVTTGMFGGARDISYHDDEGVSIDGKSFVDGGIAAPAPPTPRDEERGAVRLVVSPISGSAPPPLFSPEHSAEEISEGVPRAERISPRDSSWNLLPMEIRCNGDFYVRPSVQNLRAMKVALGAASEQELRLWYERGNSDGERAVARLIS